MKLLLEKWKKFIAEDTASLSSEAGKPKIKISYNSTFLSPFKHIQQGGYTIDQFYKDLEAEFGADWEKRLLSKHGADRKFGPEHFDALTQLAQKTQRSDLLSLINKTSQYTQKTSSGTDSSARQAGSAPIQLGDARIAAVGDSITKGYGSGGVSYIDILGGKKHAVGGAGVGDTGPNGRALMAKFKVAVDSKPEYLIIFAGVNNPFSYDACKPSGWKNKLIVGLSGWYNEAKQNGIKVVGVALLPPVKTFENHYKKCQKRPKPRGCCNNMRGTPESLYNKVLEVNNFILSNADIPIDTSDMFTREGILSAYDADGIHLNRNGQQHLANKIAAAIG